MKLLFSISYSVSVFLFAIGVQGAKIWQHVELRVLVKCLPRI